MCEVTRYILWGFLGNHFAFHDIYRYTYMENQKQNTVKVCTNISSPDQKIADAREVLSRSICLKYHMLFPISWYVFSFSFCRTANHEIVRINSAVFQNKKSKQKFSMLHAYHFLNSEFFWNVCQLFSSTYTCWVKEDYLRVYMSCTIIHT